ncbi:hypothetical protein [Pseudorhodoplanes sp.]|uniref:hypothetical protein n=1 Tax=Pseudorhodoplanes sp. TaxID=1934341 RepID=UPI00391D0E96
MGHVSRLIVAPVVGAGAGAVWVPVAIARLKRSVNETPSPPEDEHAPKVSANPTAAAAPAPPQRRLLKVIQSIVQILSGIVPAMGGRPSGL